MNKRDTQCDSRTSLLGRSRIQLTNGGAVRPSPFAFLSSPTRLSLRSSSSPPLSPPRTAISAHAPPPPSVVHHQSAAYTEQPYRSRGPCAPSPNRPQVDPTSPPRQSRRSPEGIEADPRAMQVAIIQESAKHERNWIAGCDFRPTVAVLGDEQECGVVIAFRFGPLLHRLLQCCHGLRPKLGSSRHSGLWSGV